MGVFFLSNQPWDASACFDFAARQILYEATYMLRFPRRVEYQASMDQLVRAAFRHNPMGKPHMIELFMADGSRLIVDFGSRRHGEARQLLERLLALTAPSTPAPAELAVPGEGEDEPGSGDVLAGIDETAAPAASHQAAYERARLAERAAAQAQLQSTLNSWMAWLVIVGIAQMVSARGFSSWGALMIGLALLSFFFKEPAMLMIYAASIIWAGVSNLAYADGIWKAFALLQFWWGFQLFQQFRRYQVLLPAEDGQPTRAQRIFPWAALVLGVGGLVGLVLVVGLFVLNAMLAQNETFSQLLVLGETMAIYGGMISFAAGLAGWLASFPNRWAAIAGCVLGGLTLLGHLLLSLVLVLLSNYGG